jgi:F-type H+-transporting ATPase subunit delta
VASAAAKRYADAVLDLARERGSFDAWEADLSRLAELMNDPQAGPFFASPAIPAEKKLALIDQVLADAQPEAHNLARLLVERHRLTSAPDIARLYNEGLLAERGIAIADVTTAEPLGIEEQEAVRGQLGQIIGKTIQLRLHVDESIIGGIVARVGDQLIDGSVTSQLSRLRARLVSSA